MLYDIAILGGGFWGVATAYEARKRGLSVALIDDNREQGASRCATGLVCSHWYHADTVRKMLPERYDKRAIDYSIGWMVENGKARRVGELIETYSRKGVWQFRDDCYQFDSAESLLLLTPVDIHRKVLYVLPDDEGWLVVTTGPEVRARRVLVAAGAFTNEILEASELPTVDVVGLRGRALIFASEKWQMEADSPITRMSNPYKHITIRRWGDRFEYYRIGDTTERSSDSGEFDKLCKFTREWVGDYEMVGIVDGVRPVARGKMTVGPILGDNNSLIVATGGHRVGMGLAGIVAYDVMRQFGF